MFNINQIIGNLNVTNAYTLNPQQ